MSRKSTQLIPAEAIERRIYLIRGHKVMFDRDLAELYGVPTKRPNEQVKRNRERFPADFMFQFSKAEDENLKSHIATSTSWGGRWRSRPHAFTQEGVVREARLEGHHAIGQPVGQQFVLASRA